MNKAKLLKTANFFGISLPSVKDCCLDCKYLHYDRLVDTGYCGYEDREIEFLSLNPNDMCDNDCKYKEAKNAI